MTEKSVSLSKCTDCGKPRVIRKNSTHGPCMDCKRLHLRITPRPCLLVYAQIERWHMYDRLARTG